MNRRGKEARYRLVSHPAIAEDIEALAEYGPDVVVALRGVLDVLAHGRVTGKQLGSRRVSGDLTGLARVKSTSPAVGQRGFGFFTPTWTRPLARCLRSASATSTRSTGWPPDASRPVKQLQGARPATQDQHHCAHRPPLPQRAPDPP